MPRGSLPLKVRYWGQTSYFLVFTSVVGMGLCVQSARSRRGSGNPGDPSVMSMGAVVHSGTFPDACSDVPEKNSAFFRSKSIESEKYWYS